MSAQPYEYYLGKLGQDVDPSMEGGASGYFSAPNQTLDPRLFDGHKMRPEVRSFILDTIFDFWANRYNHPHHWATVWAAGSGVSYQWAADRGNGDLDVLIGVDFTRFFADNPSYAGLSEGEMADLINRDLHDELWPLTSNWNGFEVTFFVNPGAANILNIHPYAAYNVSTNTWTRRPPHLPADPRTTHPQIFYDAAEQERKRVNDLLDHYKRLRTQASCYPPGSPGWKNAMTQQALLVQQASALFDDIHLGRRNAFGPGGEGYGDYYNFRWQSAKANGSINALKTIKSLHDEALAKANQELYGASRLDGADTLITRAALWNSGGAHG